MSHFLGKWGGERYGYRRCFRTPSIEWPLTKHRSPAIRSSHVHQQWRRNGSHSWQRQWSLIHRRHRRNLRPGSPFSVYFIHALWNFHALLVFFRETSFWIPSTGKSAGHVGLYSKVMSLRLYDVSDWWLGIRVSPWGIPPFDYVQKRFSGFCGFYGFKEVGAAHFVILSGEKRRILENGLSKAWELSRRI